ncbi:MAG: asparagine synthase (glutamine-hydrolyzing) [Pseudomonadota bacterium]
MCGIFGYFDFRRSRMDEVSLQSMGEAIAHRGPDGSGCHHDPDLGLALGNLRLAILDVEHGQQPFYSDDKKIVVVQNGEIFNFVELANSLRSEGHEFKTNSDTEVILRLYEARGIDAVRELNGMFAIAVYDGRTDELFLVRDRVGEKPLYFMQEHDRVLFASEIKSILNVCKTVKLNETALNQYFAFNYVPPPLTMFDGVKHVMPGEYKKIGRSGDTSVRWWDLSAREIRGQNEQTWIEEFNHVLNDAVRIRLRSDVPFGAFLSGGVDSSSVVGAMSKHLDQPVKTYTIGFHDPKYDESPYAEEASLRFSTEHTVRKVEPNMLDLWPLATYHCDQPHGDVSFLPTYRVASLAAKDVKMVLTGDGADELFAGYDKHRNFFNADVCALDNASFQALYQDNISLFGSEKRVKLLNESTKSRIEDFDCGSVLAPYYQSASHFDRVNQVLYLDMMLLLSGNNLVKPDRMGMAVSLENRAPFLDFRMMELAFEMPGDLKLRGGTTKYLYKKAVTPLIGEHLAYRKKQMFTVPVGDWFKRESYDLCAELLLSERARSRELFDEKFVACLLADHCQDKANNTREIRALMAVETWFRQVEKNWQITH